MKSIFLALGGAIKLKRTNRTGRKRRASKRERKAKKTEKELGISGTAEVTDEANKIAEMMVDKYEDWSEIKLANYMADRNMKDFDLTDTEKQRVASKAIAKVK